MTSVLAMPLLPTNTNNNNNKTIVGTMSRSTPVATASGLIALLSEPDPTLVKHALTKLLEVVDTLWHEVAESLPDLEAIAEGGSRGVEVGIVGGGGDEDVEMAGTTAECVEYDLPTRQTAAALASRVFFHLEEPVQALRLALESGEEHFDVVNDKGSAYVERLVNAAVEAYIQRKGREFDDATEGGEEEESQQLDTSKLQRVVELMFQRCYADGTYGHALGVAFEAREADKVKEILDRLLSSTGARDHDDEECGEVDYSLIASTLKYALEAASTLIPSKSFRAKALSLIAETLHALFEDVKAPDGVRRNAACTLVLCRQLLGHVEGVAEIITQLLNAGAATAVTDGKEGGEADDNALLGLQLCFDIVDTGDQAFVTKVANCLPNMDENGSAAGDVGGGAVVLEGSATHQSETSVEVDPNGNAAPPTAAANESGVEVHQRSTQYTSTKLSPQSTSNFLNAHRILTGGFTSELSLSFLFKQSNSDKLIMTNLKKALEERGMGRNSVLHNCAVTAHGYLNAGTTDDGFLRDHLDWMKKASNWAKFSATASMGVIHAGHTTEAMTLLEPYLPPSPSSDTDEHPPVPATGGYAEGGSLYALGLIHGSHCGSSRAKRTEASLFLRRHLRNSHANEVISHGAALGVGLTSFGSGDMEVVNELKELLYTDNAVAGEAASVAIGMVLVGSGAGNSNDSDEEMAEIIAELRSYSRETHHEKIIRGISLCLALVNFGQEENADATIQEMRNDRDPILRYGAMYALALAYCGTGSNKAVRILLHTAVSDVSDDVRMASVIGLALVLHKTPERVPDLVRLLLESFNPHVRYASCMAVGIAMAGSGDAESVALLEPMLTDMTDYVRQGALLGTAMIYMQQSDSCNHRKIKTFRDKLATIISDKHQTTLTKMGAILSTGLIDVGGRNCALHLGSRNGFTKMTSAAGLVLWLQHWHWYPFMHMLPLAVTPTCTVGLITHKNEFKYPKKFEIVCHSKPSAFAYPKKLEEKKEEKKKRVETVTLSATAKNKARLARKRAKEEAEHGEDGGAAAMDVDKKDEPEESKSEKTDDKADTKEAIKTESMEVDDAKAPESPTEDEGGATNKPKKKREPEPLSFRLPNPTRITRAQASHCSFDLNQRYRPVRPQERPYGVIMLTDSTPGEEEEEGMLGAVKSPAAEDEADPPEPFEWAPPGHPEYEGGQQSTEAGGASSGGADDDKKEGDADKAAEGSADGEADKAVE